MARYLFQVFERCVGPLDIEGEDCRAEIGEQQIGGRRSRSGSCSAYTRLAQVQTWCYQEAIKKLELKWRVR